MVKQLTIILFAVLATGCASTPASRERAAQRAAQRAIEAKQEAFALANETEHQCVTREWKEIDSRFAAGDVLAGFAAGSSDGRTVAHQAAEKQTAKTNAAYLCSLKKKM